MKIKAKVTVTALVELDSQYYKADDPAAICAEQKKYWDDDGTVLDMLADAEDYIITVEPAEGS